MNPTQERWLPVVGWEGLYEVSDHGRVRSLDRETKFKDGRVRKFYGTVLVGAPDRDGYLCLMLKDRSRKEGKKVHRLVLEAFVGPCPDGFEVLHENHQRSDNRLENLSWGSHGQNMSDRSKAGRHHMQKRTHCPRGHLLQAPNLVPYGERTGHRICRACGRANAKIVRHPELKPKFKEIADYHYARILAA